MAIANLTDENFAREIESGTVLVDFWAPWCGPCKMLAPILEELDQEIGDKIKIVKVNVDDSPSTAAKFGIMSIPTLIVFQDNKEVDKMSGVQPKKVLLGRLAEYL